LLVGVAAATLPVSVIAETVVTISKSQQQLAVTVDGEELYRWPVSTGRRGLDTPSGSFRPIRFERKWFSRQYDWSPMPYSIFFHGGYALHGTYEKRRLGQAASHGCVRLLPANAATLFSLVRREGKQDTRIVVTDAPLPPLQRLFLATDKIPLPLPRATTKPVVVAAAKPAPQVAIKVPLPPAFEPKFDAPREQPKPVVVAAVKPAPEVAINVPLPPAFEPLFEAPREPPKPVVVAAAKPAPEVAINVPLPPAFEPVFEALRETPKPVVVADAKPVENTAERAMANVPIPRVRALEPAPRQVQVAPPARMARSVARAAGAGRFVSVGDEAAVLRGREAWLRSLDRQFGIVR